MAKNRTDHALERLVFFSDAVFAIAITLLVIEIHAPHLAHDASDAEHWRALAQLIPSFTGYAISFAVIGMFWMGHHRSFALAVRYDQRVVGPNLMLLATIAFMPFVTAYLAAHFTQKVPTLVYCFTLLLAACLNLKVNGTATSAPMVDESVPLDQRAYIRHRGQAVILGAATAMALTLVLPAIGQLGLISIPFWRKLLTAHYHRRSRVSAAPAP